MAVGCDMGEGRKEGGMEQEDAERSYANVSQLAS